MVKNVLKQQKNKTNTEIIYKTDANLTTLNLVIETAAVVKNINIKAEEN